MRHFTIEKESRMSLAAQADMIVNISRRIQTLESQMAYTATTIATLAAGDEMDSGFFTSSVATYKTLVNELATEKQAYTEALKGE